MALTAEANDGWVFNRWEGDVTNTTALSTWIFMNNDEAVTAVFEEESDEGEGVTCIASPATISSRGGSGVSGGDSALLGLTVMALAALTKRRRIRNA